MTGIGVIGYGYWGPNLVRNFHQTDNASVVAVCDQSRDRLAAVNKLYSSVRTYEHVADMLLDADVEAVAVATPVSTHFHFARMALESDRHVFVEKPFTATSAQGEELIRIADDRGLTLMVDHTFVYTSAVRKMRELVESGELGELYYYDSVRVNLGLFQTDVSVLWDLAVHDLSIMDFLFDQDPVTVSAIGVSHVRNQPVNMAYLTCRFADNLIAHFHVNWLAPVKVRQALLCGSKKMVVFDDLDAREKIRVYDQGVTLNDSSNEYERRIGYRTGDMWAPRLANVEALAVEARHFVDCIATGDTPLSDGRAGLRVVKILEAAHESMARNGSPVSIMAGR